MKFSTRIFLPLVIFGVLCSSVPEIHAGASNKQPGFFTLRVHGDGFSKDDKNRAIPVVLLNGRKAELSAIPLLTEQNIQEIYPYRANNGSGGAYLRLDPHGANLLYNYSRKHMERGGILAVIINGRQVVDLVVNKPVNDGIFVIPSGLTMREEACLVNAYPIIGGGYRQQTAQQNNILSQTIVAPPPLSTGLNGVQPIYQQAPIQTFQPMQIQPMPSHPMHIYNGTITGPNGQMSYINGTSF